MSDTPSPPARPSRHWWWLAFNLASAGFLLAVLPIVCGLVSLVPLQYLYLPLFLGDPRSVAALWLWGLFMAPAGVAGVYLALRILKGAFRSRFP